MLSKAIRRTRRAVKSASLYSCAGTSCKASRAMLALLGPMPPRSSANRPSTNSQASSAVLRVIWAPDWCRNVACRTCIQRLSLQLRSNSWKRSVSSEPRGVQKAVRRAVIPALNLFFAQLLIDCPGRNHSLNMSVS